MAEDVKDKVEDAVQDGAGKLGGDSLAKRIIVPAAAGLGTLAATYAARKGPELLGRAKPKLEEEGAEEVANVGRRAAEKMGSGGGAAGKLAGKAAEKLTGGGSQKKTRRLPIQRWTDVAVPIDVAYQRWIEFDDYPKFMHRVLSVEKKGRDTVSWREKIWFWTREWEGQITERRKNEKIAWKTKRGPSHSGVVTFHKLDANLTRVMVDMNFEPTGMFEKMASGMRFVKRAVQADLARFKAYAELGEARGIDYANDVSDADAASSREQDSEDDSSSGESRQRSERTAGGGRRPLARPSRRPRSRARAGSL
jgi:uncharacterized membrane protein